MTNEEYDKLTELVHEIWKRGYDDGYKASQKEAYEKGRKVGQEEMYRQMTGTLA